jgi:UDP-glucose 4-epimerase
MKILVTGGAGFIASHIVDALVKEGHTVGVLDNLSSGKRVYVNPKATLFVADIRNKEDVHRVISEFQPVLIDHHAAQISVRVSVEDPILDTETNLLGLLNVMESGKKQGIKKVVFASSGGVVYGDASIIPTPETYVPLQPLSPYGVAKLSSEYYLNFYYKTYGIPYVALRYSNVYGPRQNPHGEAGVVAIFSQKLIKGVSPTINGDGEQTRDYVYVGDVVAANLAAVKSTFIGGVNIGTGKETNVVKIFKVISSSLRSAVLPIYGQGKSGEQRRSCLDNSLAAKVLGWIPKYSLEQGLAETVGYFKSHE